MKVLVIGGGAREHAIVSRLRSEDPGLDVICAPGNPGIAARAVVRTLDVSKPDELASLAATERADLVVVGPEVPLSEGAVDRVRRDGRLVFGPTQAAARLESSKAFAKKVMARCGVATARFSVCHEASEAASVVRSGEFGFPIVLKADGLAAGKGVVIAADALEAEAAIAAAMTGGRFGTAGRTLVVEECLSGPEVSFFVMTDGSHALPIGTAQDHKRLFDDDRGPNTGGMGAFAPSPLVPNAASDIGARVMREIVDPVLAEMVAVGCPFTGFLYVGLMLTADGPKVIEFNVRLGDPEAQVILPLIDEPLLPLLMAGASGELRQTTCRQSSDKLVGVVVASRGYPESSESGQPIAGVPDAERQPGIAVYHAGTALRNGVLVTAGGRVLTVVGRGRDFDDAIARAYAGVDRISFDGMQYRRDIGKKALSSQVST
jgi:phosphoribosylamine--glycine ligase